MVVEVELDLGQTHVLRVHVLRRQAGQIMRTGSANRDRTGAVRTAGGGGACLLDDFARDLVVQEGRRNLDEGVRDAAFPRLEIGRPEESERQSAGAARTAPPR